MSINSRAKGASAEREVVHILRDELGIDTQRNLDQWRSGGHDITGLPGWAIEVKRAKAPLIHQWWKQAKDQADRVGSTPALWYRLDRKPWRVIVPLYAINRSLTLHDGWEWTAEISPEAFCMIVRESMVCS